jgi:hypothetical protein
LDAARAWSDETFGPGPRTAGVVDHIRRELVEVEADPLDLGEWVDVIILGIDGATRAGHSGSDVIEGVRAKYERNRGRTWPDWRTAPVDRAIEHIREDRSPTVLSDEPHPIIGHRINLCAFCHEEAAFCDGSCRTAKTPTEASPVGPGVEALTASGIIEHHFAPIVGAARLNPEVEQTDAIREHARLAYRELAALAAHPSAVSRERVEHALEAFDECTWARHQYVNGTDDRNAYVDAVIAALGLPVEEGAE